MGYTSVLSCHLYCDLKPVAVAVGKSDYLHVQPLDISDILEIIILHFYIHDNLCKYSSKSFIYWCHFYRAAWNAVAV